MDTLKFSLISTRILMMIISIHNISSEKLIDMDKLKFKFPCGNSDCAGITQYCSDDERCLYCSTDICKTGDPPVMCKFHCMIYEENFSTYPKNATHTRSMLEERPIDQSKDLAISVCDDTVLIVMFGVTIGVLMTIMVITVCTLAAKKYQHREIYIDDCLCRCRKRTVDEILRGYHTTDTSPNSS